MGKLILTLILFSSVCVFSSGLLTSDPVPESVKNDRDDYKLVLNDTTLFVTHAKCQTGCDIRRRACENETLNRVCILQSTQDPMQGWKSCMTDKHELNSDNLICSRGWILPGGLECRSRCPDVFAALSWEKIEPGSRGGADTTLRTPRPTVVTQSPGEKAVIASAVSIPVLIIIILLIILVRKYKIQPAFKRYQNLNKNDKKNYNKNNPCIATLFTSCVRIRNIDLPETAESPTTMPDGQNSAENDANELVEIRLDDSEQVPLISPDVEAGQPTDVPNDDHRTTPQDRVYMANETDQLSDPIEQDKEPGPSGTPGASGAPGPSSRPPPDRVDMANETDQLSGPIEQDKEPGPSGTPGASGVPGPSSRPPPGPSPPPSPLEDTYPDMLPPPRSRLSDPSGDTRRKDNARVRLGKRTVPVNSTFDETPQPPESMFQTPELDFEGEVRVEKDFTRLYPNADPLNEENMAMAELDACGGNDNHAALKDHSTESSTADGNVSDQDATPARTQENVASAAGLQAEVVAPSTGTSIQGGTRLIFADSTSKPEAVLSQSEEALALTEAETVQAEVMSASSEAEPFQAEVMSASSEAEPVQAKVMSASSEPEPDQAEETPAPPNEAGSQSRVAPSQHEGTAEECSGPYAAQSTERSGHQTTATEVSVKKAASNVEVERPDAENPGPSPSSSQNSFTDAAGDDRVMRPGNEPKNAVEKSELEDAVENHNHDDPAD